MASDTEKPSSPPRRGVGPAPGGGPAIARGGMPVERSMDFRGSGTRLLRLLSPERPLLGLVLLCGVVSVVCTVLTPKLLGRATDLIFTGVVGKNIDPETTKEQAVAGLRAEGADNRADMLAAMDVVPGQGVDFDEMGRVLLLVLLVTLAAFVFALAQGRLTTTIVQRLVYRMRRDAQAKLSRLPLDYFDKQTRGEVLSRATNDIDNVGQTLQQAFSQMITSALTIVGVLAMMLWISPLLALIALVTVPVALLVAARIGRRAQPQFVRQWASTGQLNAHVEEMYTGHALVKVFGRQAEAKEVFDEHNEALYNSSFRAQFVSGLIQPSLMFVGNLTYVLVAVIGGLRVASGSMSLGDVQAFIQYSRQFGQPITQMASMANLLQSGVASAERVFDLLDAEEESPEPERPARPEQVTGKVTFEHVSFRYDPDKPLIEDLSLTAEPGQTVAIVGPTGAGKTTLVNLLMRFYEVTGGRICLDGVDTAAMARPELRDQIGMVLQDTWLFGGTIAENIAYGLDDVTREQVVEAARATHADHFVRTLPDGYDTVINEEGDNVSAGEKQLITIARAFLSNPSILVLDEATSSVDTRTELLIQRAMTSLREGRTSFVIAHRLSTIRDADLILVMQDGRIVEQGTHTELLAADGAYATLYTAQFAEAVVEAG